MNQIELIKVGTDLLLFLSLLWLGVRYLKSVTSPVQRQVVELERSLRGLLRDADEAGKNLNDQLFKRQQALQKLLFDVESAENKIQKGLGSLEEARRGFERPLSPPATQPLSSRIEQTIAAPTATRAQPAAQAERVRSEAPEAPAAQSTSRRVNIFGEPLPDPSEPVAAPVVEAKPAEEFATRAATPQAPIKGVRPSAVARALQGMHTYKNPNQNRSMGGLSTQIEKEITTAVPAPATPAPKAAEEMVQRAPQPEIENIYGAAERMLRAGEDVRNVARITNLSQEDVELLSRMVTASDRAIERDEQAQAAANTEPAPIIQEIELTKELEPASQEATTTAEDPRLGVLAGMRRQIQAL